MSSPRETEATVARLHALYEREALSHAALVEGVDRLAHGPSPSAWRSWLYRACLSLGVVHICGSTAYYAVVNWAELGAWGQVGLALLPLLAATLATLRLGTEGLGGKLAATAAGGLVGPVLFVLGAVSWPAGPAVWVWMTLWAALMLPSVLAARFAPAAVLWLAVVDGAVLAVHEPLLDALQGLPTSTPGLALALTDLAALLAWELLAPRVAWMQTRWAPRAIGAAAVTALVATALPTIYWEPDVAGLLALPLLVLALLAAQVRYWVGARDLFLAAVPLLAVIVLVANAGLRVVVEFIDELLLIVLGTPLLVLVLLGLTIGVLAWLRAAQLFAPKPAEAP